MRLVVDAVAVRPGSAAIVIGNLLAAWAVVAPEDQIIVLVSSPREFSLPDSVTIETVVNGSTSVLGRLWAQSAGVRHACRRLGADGLLSAVTASSFLGSSCPHGAIVYDLRHELRPGQFSVRRRLSRKILYAWSFRRADALICISERTRGDLLASRPRLHAKAHVVRLGADHAGGWCPSGDDAEPYVLAFGHFENKNVDRVLHAWRLFAAGHNGAILRVCGLTGNTRRAAERLVSELGIEHRVDLLPWLADEAFEAVFAGATAVLLPSDFEGFGLPAIEALLLGIPVVVSADPALLEVTAGHAVVSGERVEHLAAAIGQALTLTPERIAAGVAHARGFTWERSALAVRGIMVQLGPPLAGSGTSARDRIGMTRRPTCSRRLRSDW